MNRTGPAMGLTLCIATATLTIATLYSCAASAQVHASAGATAGVLNQIVTPGGGSSDRVTGVATTPDAIAPSSSTAIGGRSCYVPATSDSVSAVFVSYGGARWMLDEGCEARADAEARVGIAYARAEILGDIAGAAMNLDLAEWRMTVTREQAQAAATDREWPELWRP